MREMKHYLQQRYEFRHNTVTGKICHRRKEQKLYKDFDQAAENNLIVELEEEHVPYASAKLKALLYSDFSSPYDPLQEYFQNLPPWDGEDHLGILAGKVKTDDDMFFRVAVEKFLCLAVANWLKEGNNVNGYMLVLTGGQGIGKSTFAHDLVPAVLKEYAFQGNLLANQNDFMKKLAQKMFIILDEFDCIVGRNVSILKELITRRNIDTRLAYHKQDFVRPRIASFIGTTNLTAPLRDMSGGRRFLCFSVKSINWDTKVNLDQVYAQLYHVVKGGGELDFTREEKEKVNQRNERFTYFDMIQQAIFDRYRPATHATALRKTVKEIAKEILHETGWDRVDRSLQVRIGQALYEMGFKKAKSNGKQYYYVSQVLSLKNIQS